MSYNQYSGYGGNPYGQDNTATSGGYGASNPYGSNDNPYAGTQNYGETVSDLNMYRRLRFARA